MLTPDDLANPKRKSGYDHVLVDNGRRRDGHGGKKVAYQANGGRPDGPVSWGPRRPTALQAAQDYCDYVNGNPALLKKALKKAGRRVRRDPIDDQEVQAALGVLRDHRAQKRKQAQGYVYCIAEKGHWDAVKIGYSVKPAARVGELQTGNPRKLILLGAFQGTEEDEAALHERYMDQNILLEWFRPSRQLLSEFGVNLPTPASVTRVVILRSTNV